MDAAFASTPGCVLLQYVPNALGARGANLLFCLWLRRLRRRDGDVRVMFHEPYFYFAWQHPWRNTLALIQRMMAAVLLQASRVSYLSTETWVRYLRHLAPAGAAMVTTPIPSTVPTGADDGAVRRWRWQFTGGDAAIPVVGHFGTFGDHLVAELQTVVPAILEGAPMARFACIGQGSDAFAASMILRHPALAARIDATGALSAAEVSAALRACDVVVQPYPDGVTTRRTSVMAALANQVATVTTSGALTEAVWAQTRAVALAPASDAAAIGAATAALLHDRASRAALAETGRRVYESRFALDCTIDALLAPAGAAV
jgi:glycosyltransferase involved in cell wall biosynthesis